ncbi:MAG: hypothetical protein ACRCS6_06085 [Turicibacter sp.]
MESVIKELFKSQIPDNLIMGRTMCFGILRDAIKNMCEDLGGEFTEYDEGITGDVVFNDNPLHFHSRYVKKNYLIDDKSVLFVDEEFFVIHKTNNRRMHLDAIGLIQAVDYDYEKILSFVKLNIEHNLHVYDRI